MAGYGDGKLESLMALREPLYRSLAAITVRTDGRKVGSVADEIADRLRQLGFDC